MTCPKRKFEVWLKNHEGNNHQQRETAHYPQKPMYFLFFLHFFGPNQQMHVATNTSSPEIRGSLQMEKSLQVLHKCIFLLNSCFFANSCSVQLHVPYICMPFKKIMSRILVHVNCMFSACTWYLEMDVLYK